MASLEADLSGVTCGGYDLKLVDGGSLTNKYICPVCQLVAREPHKAECGQVYCKSCLQKIKSKENNFVCPTCQGFPCDFFFDNQADLEIKSLRVFCKNTKCYWKGNLGDINDHLQECLYQLILCHSCNASLHRRNLNEHLRSKCPKRQIPCGHCNQIGTFEYITNRHRLLCAVKCTNEECNEMMPPQQLSSHKELLCAKETISCQFSTIGCEKLIKREHKMLHNVEWKDQHMLLAVREIDDLKKSKKSLKCKIEDLEEATTSNSKRTNLQANLRRIQVEQASFQDLQHTVLNNLQFETSKLQEGLTNLQSSVEVLEKSQKITDRKLKCLENKSTLIKFHGFAKLKENDAKWSSPSFYTAPGGYKMCLNVYANRAKDAKGTPHISCFIRLMPGEYDSLLQWPFQGSITIELLNQLEDSHHCKDVLEFTISTPLECTAKVNVEGWGYGKFISHDELNYDGSLNCQFLKNDTLYFRLSSNVTSKTKPWLVQ